MSSQPPPQPDLPQPAHVDLESMLSRRFGKEVANYFSGSPINRLSFLRNDNKFLSAALLHPSTSFLLLNALAPLAQSAQALAYASYSEVSPLLPSDPYGKHEDELISAFNSTAYTPQLIFLGVDESAKSDFKWNIYTGKPFFALDVTPKSKSSEAAETLIKTKEDAGLTFLQGRTHMTLPAPEAAIYAEARALMDWNARNPFCAGCGQPTLSVNAGFKRVCPPTDWGQSPKESGGALAGTSTGAAKDTETTGAAAHPPARPDCATRKGISNLSFPRTDPTIIVAVLSADSQRILLGRQKRWPEFWYSTLAGFCEPAESVEEAVRREVWEESGILLGRVQVHSTQPWPYPANLMIGAVGQAVPGGETVVLEHDPELEDARWFTLEEVREALRVGTGGLDDMSRLPEGYKEGNLRLPPKTAIANQLLEAVVGGWATGGVERL